MIVTDRDIVIAHYAIRSYSKIKNLKFKLRIYSNWLSVTLKMKYFPLWRQFPYVEIIENNWQDYMPKPDDPGLQGPYEKRGTILDRELKTILTPYVATVDADFELLNPDFIFWMLDALDAQPNLIAVSYLYVGRKEKYFDSYSQRIMWLDERWHNAFCIYKKKAFECNVSHCQREEPSNMDGVQCKGWDTSAYFQKALREVHGYQLSALQGKFKDSYIHYENFSNIHFIDQKNVGIYRWLRIVSHCGFPLTRHRRLYLIDSAFRSLAGRLHHILFHKAERSKLRYPRDVITQTA
jgi:hypothetical protein